MPMFKKALLIMVAIAFLMLFLSNLQRFASVYSLLKKALLVFSLTVIALIVFLFLWYDFFFFPDDQKYLQGIADSIVYRGDDFEEVETDLLRDYKHIQISSPLTSEDRKSLLNRDLKQQDLYVDDNPWGNGQNPNNLKYATGKIFYYTYQKNSLVLKSSSSIIKKLLPSTGKKRFLEFDYTWPLFKGTPTSQGSLLIEYIVSGQKKTLYSQSLRRELKPEIKPFRYSNPFSSLFFYLRHPRDKVLKEYTGWEKVKISLPLEPGELRITFLSDSKDNSFLFLGSPRIYRVLKHKRDQHINILYLLCDTLARYQIDLYEKYDIFSREKLEDAFRKIGKRDLITPALDRYYHRAGLLDRLYSAGQVTRPSIVALWTSRPYTESRLPVFRNLVTDDNQKEFYQQGLDTLGEMLSSKGYFTKQISCNSQGHGVSGVGVDLGFDENYDYTMDPSQRTENFRRIMYFLQENQNRKIFLYAHINIPHVPRWIPLKYYLKALWDCDFLHDSAVILGNLRYLNDSLDKVFQVIDKLKLMKNSLVIVTADHSMGYMPKFRSYTTGFDENLWKREPQGVADFPSRAIYTRKGGISLYEEIVNIPWLYFLPDNLRWRRGKTETAISALDISPTLLDITVGKKSRNFYGKSFNDLLTAKLDVQTDYFTEFIPFAGRFQRGFVYQGRYKYWRNITGLYKYKTVSDKIDLIMQQEYIYDLKKDPYELDNLALDQKNPPLLNQMRALYEQRYIDYPAKSFIQISPDKKGKKHTFTFEITSSMGTIRNPGSYGDHIQFKLMNPRSLQVKVLCDKSLVNFSFETYPPNADIKILVRRDGRLLSRKEIFSTMEKLNIFDNPLTLNKAKDRNITTVPGRTGLEEWDIPDACVFYARIPLNYWLEMSRSDKDIKLSPGMKEVLRGWGYIQ